MEICGEVDQTMIEVESPQICDVQGRLKECISFWADTLHASIPVIEWVQNGYKLPLIGLPPCLSNLTIFQPSRRVNLLRKH